MHPTRTLVLLLFVCLAARLPAFTAEKETRVFEMRTYTAPPGKLDALLARFRDLSLIHI